VSEIDTLNATYAYVQARSTPISSSSSFTSRSFTIESATIGWSRSLTPNLSASVGGGGILINPGQTTTYAANAAVIMNFLNYSATISYAHSAVPSFFAGGGVRIVDTVSLSAVQRIDRQWQLAESVSYAHSASSGVSGPNATTFDSYVAGGEIQYWVTSIWSTSLSYSYSKFTTNTGFNNWDRQAFMLSVRATWE
jgi:hypothetical protein